jgi:hypothetical protein
MKKVLVLIFLFITRVIAFSQTESDIAFLRENLSSDKIEITSNNLAKTFSDPSYWKLLGLFNDGIISIPKHNNGFWFGKDGLYMESPAILKKYGSYANMELSKGKWSFDRKTKTMTIEFSDCVNVYKVIRLNAVEIILEDNTTLTSTRYFFSAQSDITNSPFSLQNKLAEYSTEVQSSKNLLTQQNSISDYIFPKGIMKSTFNNIDPNGYELKDWITTYKYTIKNNNATVINNVSMDGDKASDGKNYYIITDTVIYLVKSKGEAILGKSIINTTDDDFKYNNCYLKLPPKNGFAKWSYVNGKDSKSICKAYFVNLIIDDERYDAIKVEKTPFQQGKYLPEFKTYEYYVKGKGLYKLNINGDKSTFLRLSSEDFTDDILSDNSNIVTPPSEIASSLDEDYGKVFTSVQIEAEFPGGATSWAKYLQRNLNDSLPSKNGAPIGKYTVTVSFLIDKNGNISQVVAENDPKYGTAEEAIRVIEKGPAWKPAVQNGHNVPFRKKQEITFVVKDKK